jgi:predicted negative regulator of RcsB-dependent stress response
MLIKTQLPSFIYLVNRHLSSLAVLLFCLLLFFCIKPSYSQSADTLMLAKQLNEKRKFIKAEKLLQLYCDKHQENLNAQWLYAQITYFAKHFKKSQFVYENAIKKYPENYTLRLDYAKKLVDIGEFEKAIPILNLYLTYDSLASDAHEALAKISFWKAEYEKALVETDRVLSKQPGNVPLRNLQNEILLAKSPWLKANAGYSTDDQPLQKITSFMEAGVSLHPLANIRFGFQSPLFVKDKDFYNTQQFTAGNKLLFSKPSIEVNMEGGIIKLPNNKIAGAITLQLSKTILKNLVLSTQVEHQPYLNTRSSMENPIMRLNYSFAAAWNTKNSWQGRAAYDHTYFYTDKNYIYTTGAWLISPPIKISAFDFRFGYGYNFNTAKENRFVSEKPLNDIVAGWSALTPISGIYNPYFTPYKQRAHAVILAVNIHPSKRIDIGMKGNICFNGTTNNPYLYLTKDTHNQFVITSGYSKLAFFPVEISAYVATKLDSKIIFKCEYIFTHNNFYTSHYAGVSLKISFWNEK